MPRGTRLPGLLILGLAVFPAGCVNADRAAVLKSFEPTFEKDLEDPETPRVTRGQRSSYQPRPPAVPATFHEPPGLSSNMRIRAWVNGKPIFDLDVIQKIFHEARIPPAAQSHPQVQLLVKEKFKDFLDAMIDDEILYQDAITKLEAFNPKALKDLKKDAHKEFDKHIQEHLDKTKKTMEEFVRELRQDGQTLDIFEASQERNFISVRYLSSRVYPIIQEETGHNQLQDYYEKHKNEFIRVDRVKWQDVFIAVGEKHPTPADARRFAETLMNRLRQGEDFSNLLQYDEGVSRFRKGEGIGQRPGEIQPVQLEKYLFDLRSGQVGPPVELDTGIHIFRVVEREYRGFRPFDDELQKTIRNKLSNEIFMRERKRIVQELRSRSVIRIEKD